MGHAPSLADVRRAWEARDPELANLVVALCGAEDARPKGPQREGALTYRDHARVAAAYPASASIGDAAVATANPDEPAARTTFLERADDLAQAFRRSAGLLEGARQDANDRIRDGVRDVNEKLEAIASLSKEIARIEAVGDEASDLRDRRDQLVREVAEVVPVNVLEGDDGRIDLMLAGSRALVDRAGQVYALSAVADPATGDVRVTLPDIRPGEQDFRAHRLEVKDLFLTHLVRNDDDQAVSFLAGDQGEAETGVAGGRLDDRAARFQAAVPFRGFDHRQADAVLDGPAGILVFQFHEQAAGTGIDLPQFDDRRVADQFDDVARGGHGVRPLGFADRQVRRFGTDFHFPKYRISVALHCRAKTGGSAFLSFFAKKMSVHPLNRL